MIMMMMIIMTMTTTTMTMTSMSPYCDQLWTRRSSEIHADDDDDYDGVRTSIRQGAVQRREEMIIIIITVMMMYGPAQGEKEYRDTSSQC